MAQLKVQADKCAVLRQEGDEEWDIRHAGLAVGGVPVEAPLIAEDLRSASKSFKKRTHGGRGLAPQALCGII